MALFFAGSRHDAAYLQGKGSTPKSYILLTTGVLQFFTAGTILIIEAANLIYNRCVYFRLETVFIVVFVGLPLL